MNDGQTNTVSGIVRLGKQMGRTLGFPTANLEIPEHALPKDGVWAAMVTLDDGRKIPCVLNQGKHPTLPEGNASIEAHLLHFEENLYGRHICITYQQYLRPERKFASVAELKRQIQQDKADAIAWFAQQEE